MEMENSFKGSPLEASIYDKTSELSKYQQTLQMTTDPIHSKSHAASCSSNFVTAEHADLLPGLCLSQSDWSGRQAGKHRGHNNWSAAWQRKGAERPEQPCEQGRIFVGCLTSQQHASVSQERICSDNCTCCHTEVEVADQTFHLTQSQYTDTGPTSPSTDPTPLGAWQGSHWSAGF